MPAYATFVGGTLVVLTFVLVLTILTQQRLEPAPGGARIGEETVLTTSELYLNVFVSQLLVAAILLGLVFFTGVPTASLGVGAAAVSAAPAVGIGIALGAVLYVLNELSVGLLDRFDIDYSEDLRAALAPGSARGWLLLVVVVLPLIAAAEELLFRAILIGGLAVALDVSPWLLVLASSVAFALGHGIQGTGGIIVTGALGLVLGAAFVLSGSLLLVVVAHYVVNALEFGVNEGLGIDLFGGPA